VLEAARRRVAPALPGTRAREPVDAAPRGQWWVSQPAVAGQSEAAVAQGDHRPRADLVAARLAQSAEPLMVARLESAVALVAAVAGVAVAAPLAAVAEQAVIPAAAAQEVVAAAPAGAVEQVVIPAAAAAQEVVAAAPAGAAEQVVIPAVAAAQEVAAVVPVAAVAEVAVAALAGAERELEAAALDAASAELGVDRAAAVASSPSHVRFVVLAQPGARRQTARPGSIQRPRLTGWSQR
jgi:hypothetical protein